MTAPDEIDPLDLIVQALRDNTDATKAALTASEAVRRLVTTSDTRASERSTQAATDIENLTEAINRLTVGEEEIQKAKDTCFVWAVSAFILGGFFAMACFILLPPYINRLLDFL